MGLVALQCHGDLADLHTLRVADRGRRLGAERHGERVVHLGRRTRRVLVARARGVPVCLGLLPAPELGHAGAVDRIPGGPVDHQSQPVGARRAVTHLCSRTGQHQRAANPAGVLRLLPSALSRVVGTGAAALRRASRGIEDGPRARSLTSRRQRGAMTVSATATGSRNSDSPNGLPHATQCGLHDCEEPNVQRSCIDPEFSCQEPTVDDGSDRQSRRRSIVRRAQPSANRSPHLSNSFRSAPDR